MGDTLFPAFDNVEVPCVHEFDGSTSLPITGSAAIDTDGDGTEEFFIGGGSKQQNDLFRFVGGGFEGDDDLDLDDREDLVVSENFVNVPFHKVPLFPLPQRQFVKAKAGEMAAVGSQADVINRYSSIAPLTADFNVDGRGGIVHINLVGPSHAFLSTGDTANGFLKIKLPETLSSIGAIVMVTLEDGTTVHKPFVSGGGLASDSSRIIIAGLR